MPEYKKYNVYLSSTFRDLENHRKAVIEFFHHYPERFDVMYMERYVAESRPPLDRCLEDVRHCDMYILLVGRRYGYIPGEDPGDAAGAASNPDRYSVTHAEFNEARRTQKTTLIFLSDPDDPSLPTDGGPLAGEKAQRLSDFRGFLGQNYLAKFFSGPDNLTVHVVNSILPLTEILLRPEERAKLVQTEHRFCCDRTVQFNEYWLNSYCTNYFKTYLIHGRRSELGDSFIKRIGIFSLNLATVETLDFQGILNSLVDETKIRTQFLIALLQKTGAIPATGGVPTPQDVIAAIHAAGRRYHAVHIVLEEADRWDAGFRVLQTLLTDFHAACQEAQTVRMIWFLEVIDIDVKTAVDRTAGLAPFDLCFHGLTELTSPRVSDVRAWLREYLTADLFDDLSDPDSPYRIPEFVDLRNAAAAGPLRMKQVERALKTFIDKFNAKDPALLQALDA